MIGPLASIMLSFQYSRYYQPTKPYTVLFLLHLNTDHSTRNKFVDGTASH